ncbi:hypothetical protein SLS60_009558 [Paraconiothyrium brasiliense]|uniref:Uncharacterized protein n=1 Tax=Paraconiothyrium brasiliense TaxID=300254 RepID=A0ABR3QUM7_9PLEO
MPAVDNMSPLSVREEQVFLNTAFEELSAFEQPNLDRDDLCSDTDIHDTVMNHIRELGHNATYTRWYWQNRGEKWVPCYIVTKDLVDTVGEDKIEKDLLQHKLKDDEKLDERKKKDTGRIEVVTTIDAKGCANVVAKMDAEGNTKVEVNAATTRPEDGSQARNEEGGTVHGAVLKTTIEIRLKHGPVS